LMVHTLVLLNSLVALTFQGYLNQTNRTLSTS